MAETQIAEVTVGFVNPPKEGKKRGSIKASDGNYYWGSAAQINLFSKGETCRIEYESSPKEGGEL